MVETRSGQKTVEEKSQWHGEPIFPVFVTANVPVKTINKLFTTAYKHSDPMFGLYLVGSTKYSPVLLPTQPPIPETFTSGFVGKSVEEVVQWYNAGINVRSEAGWGPDHLTVNTLMILDEQSAKDGSTVLLVGTLGQEDEGIRTARSDFWVPMDVLSDAEDGDSILNEGRENQGFEEADGTWLYTRKRWDAYISTAGTAMAGAKVE